MNIEKIELGTIYKIQNRDDLEIIKFFLEKKYGRQVIYTIFKKNMVVFVGTNLIIER